MVSPLMRRLEKLEQDRRGGGLWVTSAYADDPEGQRKIDAATDRAITELGANPSDLFITVARFANTEGKFPANYSAARINAGN